MMEEEWTKVRTTRSKRILFSSFKELCHFRYDAALFLSSINKKKCLHCMLKPELLTMLKPSIPVKSGNILRILLVW